MSIPGGGEVESVPAELRALPQWVGWRKVDRDGKATKVPVCPATGGNASSTDPATWATFTAALGGAAAGHWDGVGFVFTQADPYVGIDLDDVIDPGTGEIDPDAVATIERFRSYAELSPSGTGVHIFVRGELPPGGRKRGDRECYDRARFFTVTGKIAGPAAIAEAGAELARWHAETFPAADRADPPSTPRRPVELSDQQLLAKIGASKQGPKLAKLWTGDTSDYPSGSEADLALCNILAWWTGGDAAAVDRLFRSSGLMREKWDRQRGEQKYGERTVAKAVADLTGGYDPAHQAGTDPRPVFGPSPADAPQPAQDGITPDFDFATNDDLKRLDVGTKWVWERWLQVGAVNLLAAEGGLGKTRFVADLCRRVHLGLPWPDGQPTTPWGGQYLAMWVAGDRNHGELVSLSEKFGFGDRICYSGSKVDPLGGITLNSATDFTALAQKVKAARPLFVVVDTAGGATSRNLSKQEEARDFFAPQSDLAARLGVCVIDITHLNASKKILGKRAEERVRCVIRMTAANREPATLRRVEVIKSNSLFPAAIGMALGETGNEYTDKPPPPPEDEERGGGAGADKDDPDRGPPTKCRECMDWLSKRLAAQPERVGTIRVEAEEKGYSAKVVYKAKEALNLVETTVQGKKWWGLSAPAVAA